MAVVTKVGTPSLSDVLPPANDRLSELIASVAIEAGDLCRIHSDGTVRLCDGTAVNALALYDGVAAKAASIGQPVTLLHGVIMRYGSGLTIPARYYVSATPGALETIPTVGGTIPVAKAINATEIYFFHPNQ